MCWKSHKTPVKEIATEDIVVQKVLTRNNNGMLVSPVYCSHNWEETKEVSLSKDITVEYDYYFYSEYWNIGYGFHSCEKITIGFGNKWYCHDEYIFGVDDSDILCEFIIPKGSIYYKNENGCYVSNRLRFVRTIPQLSV